MSYNTAQGYFIPNFLSSSLTRTVINPLVSQAEAANFYQTSVASSSSGNKSPTEPFEDTEKITRRRIANRLAQRKSRERKDQVRELLMLENSQLRDEIASLKGQLKILKEMGVRSDSEFMMRNEQKLEQAQRALEEGRLKLTEKLGSIRTLCIEELNTLVETLQSTSLMNNPSTETSAHSLSITEPISVTYLPP